MAPLRIIGIDPGLTTTGIGLIEADGQQVKVVEWLTITTEKGLSSADRLNELGSDLKKYLSEAKPDLAVVEKMFFAANKHSAIGVSQARGVILSVLAQAGIPVLEPGPLELKTAVTGDGRADKRQVADMVVRTLRLKEKPSPADAADGLALALYGAFRRDQKTAVSGQNLASDL